MKINYLYPFVFTAMIMFVPTQARGDAMDWLKGCLILGGVNVGGTAMAASQSRIEFKDSQALILSGVTGCLIGGFISKDLVKKAEMRASAELTTKNRNLRNQIYSVMHDLCVMKGTCGPDGVPFDSREIERGFDSRLDYVPLKSGN